MTRRKPTAPARSPWWMTRIHEFDGVEIHPCRTETAADGSTYQEQCEPEAAEVWSVFGHRVAGGVDCFMDFLTEAEARGFAKKLLATYPNLMKFGLFG